MAPHLRSVGEPAAARLGRWDADSLCYPIPAEVWLLRSTDEKRYGMTGGCISMRSMESDSDYWVDLVHASRLNYTQCTGGYPQLATVYLRSHPSATRCQRRWAKWQGRRKRPLLQTP